MKREQLDVSFGITKSLTFNLLAFSVLFFTIFIDCLQRRWPILALPILGRMTKKKFWEIISIGSWLIALLVFLVALHHRQVYSEDCSGLKQWKVENYGYIDNPAIEESSGLVHVKKDLFWTHNDDEDYNLYLINLKGDTRYRWPVKIQNNDWEDITTDSNGYLYIGNFGNNFNLRRKVSIWKLDPFERNRVYPIIIHYAEQGEFAPPIPGFNNFDVEGMVYHEDSLYLFTKNKNEKGFNVYAVADKPGHANPKIRQSVSINGMVTGACLSPDHKHLALLTYQRIYFFKIEPGFRIADAPYECIPIWKGRQMEAISWFRNDSILVSNEQRDLFLISKRKPDSRQKR